MRIGYARVSTLEQNLGLQTDALTTAGCGKIFTDQASGAKEDRPGLLEAMEFLRPEDTLVVWKLDRLGRSLPHLVALVRELEERGVGFQSLKESIDTTTSGGKLVFHLFAALAEFERDIIRERTQAGLTAARARGRKGGRPTVLPEKKRAIAQALRKDPSHSVAEICRTLGISRTTFYRYTEGEAPSADTSGATLPSPS
jgi:DNA invertase Pin-like site-specific DNA recombinase